MQDIFPSSDIKADEPHFVYTSLDLFLYSPAQATEGDQEWPRLCSDAKGYICPAQQESEWSGNSFAACALRLSRVEAT